MVYTGRPSTGCAQCRERRKKCDETRPACMNCVRLGRQCPGFPDELDLMFKNETEAVTQKATQAARSASSSKRSSPVKSTANLAPSKDTILPSREIRAAQQRPSSSSSSSSSKPLFSIESQDSDPPWSSMWNPDTVSAATLTANSLVKPSFFNTLILQPRSARSPGNKLDVLIEKCPAGDWRSPLYLVTEAIAIRSIANSPGNDHLIFHAHELYEAGLRAVHNTTAEANEQSKEEASMSVLLLALYECVASSGIQHTDFYLQSSIDPLAFSKGTPASEPCELQLFRIAREQTFSENTLRQRVLACLSSRESRLGSQHSQHANHFLANYPTHIPDVLAKATELLLPTRDRTVNVTQEVEALLQKAYDLQTELYRWDMNVPPKFGYRSVTPTESAPSAAGLWPGPVHLYDDVHIASIRNNNRVSQLLCSNVVMEALRWLEPDGYAEDRRFKAAQYRVQYLVDDIAASVPFHFGYGTHQTGGYTASSNTASRWSNISDVRVRGGFLLIWPLYVASQMRSISLPQRAWLIAKLGMILQHHGLERSEAS